MEHRTICEFNILEFDKRVNSALSQGWEFGSGLIIDSNDQLIRSMIRTVKPKKKPVKQFQKPTIAEVNEFEKSEKLNLSGFHSYYESNGWKVGRNPMKDWKAAARNWNKRDFGNKPEVKTNIPKAFNFNEIDKAQAAKSDPEKVKRMMEQYRVTGQLTMGDE